MKYEGTYNVIFCSDLNRTLLESRSNKQDRLLRNFVHELQLGTGNLCGTKPTFYHHAGTTTSQIDCVLVQDKGGGRYTGYHLSVLPVFCSSIIPLRKNVFGYISKSL